MTASYLGAIVFCSFCRLCTDTRVHEIQCKDYMLRLLEKVCECPDGEHDSHSLVRLLRDGAQPRNQVCGEKQMKLVGGRNDGVLGTCVLVFALLGIVPRRVWVQQQHAHQM